MLLQQIVLQRHLETQSLKKHLRKFLGKSWWNKFMKAYGETIINFEIPTMSISIVEIGGNLWKSEKCLEKGPNSNANS